MLKNQWLYCDFVQKGLNRIGFTMFSLKNIKKKKHGFTVFSLKKIKKTSGFIVFSLKNNEKPMVLLCVRSKMLKNHWFYKQRGLKTKKTIGFTVKPVPSTDSGRETAILAGEVMRNPHRQAV